MPDGAANSSVDQVFDVLAVLSASEAPVGVAQLARALDVPTSTAHRVLVTLQEAGYVARDTTGAKYQLGLGAQELTHALLRRFPVETAALPFLRRIAAATGDTVVLTCRIGWYGVRMAGTEGWREIHAAPRLGQTARLGDTPGGRAILAFLGKSLLDGYLHWATGSARPAAATRELRASLERIGADGELLDRHDDGRFELALPLRDGAGHAIAAITVEAAEPDGGARAERARLSRARGIAGELEAFLRDRPQLTVDPFAHLAPDELDPGFDVTAAAGGG